MLTREQVLLSINQLPDKFSVDEVIDKIILLEKIENGLMQSQNNQVIAETSDKSPVKQLGVSFGNLTKVWNDSAAILALSQSFQNLCFCPVVSFSFVRKLLVFSDQSYFFESGVEWTESRSLVDSFIFCLFLFGLFFLAKTSAQKISSGFSYSPAYP